MLNWPSSIVISQLATCRSDELPCQDDMELAPDFFGYFAATAPLLDADDSLLCVSSWNDHGQAKLVRDAARLLRTDFFPGLGWMLTARLWDELRCAAPCAAGSFACCHCPHATRDCWACLMVRVRVTRALAG